jgi:uncharacterized membrane protein
MKQAFAFITRALVSGILIVVPLYLTILLLLKAMRTLANLVHPVAILLPDWIPAEDLLSLLLLLGICVLIGIAVRTPAGRAARNKIEKTFFEKIPGYALFKSLTQQMAGNTGETAWKPALYEGDEGLMPAFIIEEFGDGRYTVFVPSIPTPLAGATYVVAHKKVHPLDVPFTDALKTVSRWGSGARHLVEVMEQDERARSTGP